MKKQYKTPDQIRDLLANLTPLPTPLQGNGINPVVELPRINIPANPNANANAPVNIPILAALPPITALPKIIQAPATVAPATVAPATVAPATVAPATVAPATVANLKLSFTTLDKGDPETVEIIQDEKINPLGISYKKVVPQSGFIMKILEYDQIEIAEHISKFFGSFKGTKDETIALYWWGLIYANLNIIRNAAEINEIHKLTNEQLQTLVPIDWSYPRDRASIIFKLLTGYNPPRADATKELRYQSLINTSPLIIQRLSQYVYNYFGPEKYGGYEFCSQYTPYRHIALQTISVLEPFIINYTPDKTEYLAGRMGMIIPNNVNKEKYFFENVKYYAKILTRNPKRLFPVPDLTDVPTNNINKLLEPYTDEELLDGYEMNNKYYQYKGRENLINNIKNERSRTNNVWQFRKYHCLNADRNNIFELEPRIDSDADPIISYGTMKNYRCWNKSELEELWEERNGFFNFVVPDWKLGDPYKTFPSESIKELRSLLAETKNPIFNILIEKIDLGLDTMANANKRLKTYKDYYAGLSQSDKELVTKYLIWMFLTSMYMRFWKGPNYPYPEVWVEGGGGNDLCEPPQRSKNVNKQFLLRSRILATMKPEIEQWVLSFPRIEYNFKEGTSAVGVETINFIVEEAQMGNFCLAEASDHLVQTSYYLLTRILNINLKGFNQTVNKYLTDLNQGVKVERDFNPLATTRTRHVDPHHKLQKF